MAPQKETMMALKVDLECDRCYTKVKRTLCQFPQVQDQIYNDKQNTVIIKVVCCSPEKIMAKIKAKGGKSIQDIKIFEPKKPEADKPKDAPKDTPKQAADKPKDTPKQAADNKPKDTPKQADNKPPKDAAKPPPADDKSAKKKVTFNTDAQPAKPPGDGAAKPTKEAAAAPPPAALKPAGQAALMAPMVPSSVYGYGYPVNMGCLDCYEGRMCYHHTNGYGYGYGTPAPPPPQPAGGYGYGYGYGYGVPPPPPPAYGYKPGYCVSRYGDYVSDENASGCVVM